MEDHNSGLPAGQEFVLRLALILKPENNGLSFHDLQVLKRGTGLEVVGKISFEAN